MSNRRAIRALIIVILVVVVIVGLWAIGVHSIRTRPGITVQGDELGRGLDETPQQYAARAADTLRGDDSDEHWAMVAFPAGTSYQDAAETVQPVKRMSAVAFKDLEMHDVAEPVAGEDRTDVIEREATREQARSGAVNPPLSGVIVRDTLPVLDAVAADPRVFAVEALPADARWKAFGVSLISPDQSEPAQLW